MSSGGQRSLAVQMLYVVVGSVAGAALAFFVHTQVEAAMNAKPKADAIKESKAVEKKDSSPEKKPEKKPLSEGRKVVRKMSKRGQLFANASVPSGKGKAPSITGSQRTPAPQQPEDAQKPHITFASKEEKEDRSAADSSAAPSSRRQSASNVASTFLIVQAAKEKWLSKRRSSKSKAADEDEAALNDCLSHLSESRTEAAEKRFEQWDNKMQNEEMDLNVSLDDDIASVQALGNGDESSDDGN